MKKILNILSITLLLAFSAKGNVTIALDAGQLLTSSSTALVADNISTTSSNGALLLLIGADSNGNFNNTLTAGSFVSGSDIVLGAAGFNTSIATNETGNSITIGGGFSNEKIELMWFPQITLAQYLNAGGSGSLLLAGYSFGVYNPNGGGAIDSSKAWLLPDPSGGASAYGLVFNTLSASGSNPDSAGKASQVVVAPEPTSIALLGSGLLMAGSMIRRRK